jgi:hypothetical protein
MANSLKFGARHGYVDDCRQDNNPTPDGKTLGHHRRKLEATKQTYKVLSQVGLFFMFVGFVLQFAATIYGAKYG